MLDAVRGPDLWQVLDPGQGRGKDAQEGGPVVNVVNQDGRKDDRHDGCHNQVQAACNADKHSRLPAGCWLGQFVIRDGNELVLKKDQKEYHSVCADRQATSQSRHPVRSCIYWWYSQHRQTYIRVKQIH